MVSKIEYTKKELKILAKMVCDRESSSYNRCNKDTIKYMKEKILEWPTMIPQNKRYDIHTMVEPFEDMPLYINYLNADKVPSVRSIIARWRLIIGK